MFTKLVGILTKLSFTNKPKNKIDPSNYMVTIGGGSAVQKPLIRIQSDLAEIPLGKLLQNS